MIEDNILLDTCVLLWLANGDNRLSQATKSQLLDRDNVFISAITGFEISLKYAKDKLKLPLLPHLWLEQMVDFYQLSIIPLDLDICIQSTLLDAHHNDPCDRFIIATALKHHLPIMTGDSVFTQYPVSVIHI